MRLRLFAFLLSLVLVLGGGYFWLTQDITKKDSKVITELAIEGSALAQRELAIRYESGIGIDKNSREAKEWYQKAAAQNDSYAQRQLGVMYESGTGTAKNTKIAKEWYEKAAYQDDIRAQVLLGGIYKSGFDDAPPDAVKAKEWYEKAAQQDEIQAQILLGNMYKNGYEGVPKNYVKAYEWYKKAAKKGNASAQHQLGLLYLLGHGVQKDYGRAIQLFEKAASDDAYYQFKLGNFYRYGYKPESAEPQYAKAKDWYELSASNGHLFAQLTLAEMSETGEGVRQDKAKAKEWYGKVCDQGYGYGCDDFRRMNEEEVNLNPDIF